MKKISNIIDRLTHYVSYAAIWSTFFLMMMTSMHVILRKFTVYSVPGAMELTELSLVVIVFCAISYLQSQRGHVRVNMFVDMLPARVGRIIEFIILVISAIMLYIMFYAGIMQVKSQMGTGIKTNVLLIPLWPFVIVMTIGLIFYALSLSVHAAQALVSAVKGPEAELTEEEKEIAFDV